MKNQRIIQIALILTPAVCTIMCGLVTVQTMWVYAQGNFSQVMNQTRTKLEINLYLLQSQDNKAAHHQVKFFWN